MAGERGFFAYGTLQLEAVFVAVAGFSRRSFPARLPHYQRYRLRGRAYPAIVPVPDHGVDGVFYPSLDASTFTRLDAFEDHFYQRLTVEVSVEGAGWRSAETYVLRPEAMNLIDDADWSLQQVSPADVERLLSRSITSVGAE